MGKVKAQLSISLDGYAAGPNQSEENPLGEGGEGLHEWVYKLPSWHRAHGREGEGDADNPSDAVLVDSMAGTGAVVMGRNMFGPVRGEWEDSDWRGWWGEEPPFHAPVFVLTHHAREPLEMGDGTVFQFVTDGIEGIVARAREAACGEDVSIAGGASTIQQAIAAGLVDELLVNLVPILLGGGDRLFDKLPAASAGFELIDLVRGPDAAHLTYSLTR